VVKKGPDETIGCIFKAKTMAIIFGKHSKDGYKKPLKGIRQKTLCYGSRTLMTEFLLDKDNVLPMHSHPYEQTGYLVKGHILLKIGDNQHDTLPGDSWCIPTDVTHGAQIIEDSVAIEIFSPVREDYIPKDTD
jgi:quercetin dioxygenase-like cupin family protein